MCGHFWRATRPKTFSNRWRSLNSPWLSSGGRVKRIGGAWLGWSPGWGWHMPPHGFCCDVRLLGLSFPPGCFKLRRALSLSALLVVCHAREPGGALSSACYFCCGSHRWRSVILSNCISYVVMRCLELRSQIFTFTPTITWRDDSPRWAIHRMVHATGEMGAPHCEQE